MVLARDAIVGGVFVHRRLTPAGLTWFLSGVAVITALGCGNADPGEPLASGERTLSRTEARVEIAAMCPGPFRTYEQCASCAEQATSVLEEYGRIPPRQVVIASFVGQGCVEPAEAEAESCAVEVPIGPDFQRCVCNDGTTIDRCAEVECSSALAQDDICVEVCRCNGGLFGTACVAGAAACTK